MLLITLQRAEIDLVMNSESVHTVGVAAATSGDSGTFASRERRLSSAVFHWATGSSDALSGRVALCADLEAATSLIRRGAVADTFIVPRHGDSQAEGVDSPQILTFEGSFRDPGDVMHIGRGYEIELQDYLAVPFVPVTRPTVVSCLTSSAWSAFVEDADEAMATGMFIPQLASHSVVLADRAVIDAAIDGVDVPISRLTVDSAESIRYRLGGPVVGTASSLDLDAQPASAFLLAEGEPEAAGVSVADEFAGRPWIRRYLNALRIVGGAEGDTWSVSGFGEVLVDVDLPRNVRRSGHLIIWRGDEYQLVADSGRRFSLGRETAVAAESLLEAASFDDAIDIARAAGLGRTSMRLELRELGERFAAVGVFLDGRDLGVER